MRTPWFKTPAADNAAAVDAAAVDADILDMEPMVRNFGAINPKVLDLYALYLRNAETLHRDLCANLTAGDIVGARLAAHGAAGAARMAGARRVASRCSGIEEALARGDVAAALRDVEGLADELADVERMIARI